MTYKDGSWGDKAKARSQKRKGYFKKYRENHKALNLLRRYGITELEYQEMLKKQKGCCAICGVDKPIPSHNSKDGSPQRLAIDHCHETGKVRGLLCFSCNRGIGYLKDSIELLESAIIYLKQ